jgi:flagellar biosynthesis protein FlhF
VIFTKLDEAVNFGVLVNVARRIEARLSFVTTGQEVPDKIERGAPERIARLVLEGGLAP